MAPSEQQAMREGIQTPPTRRKRTGRLVFREQDLGLGWLEAQERALLAWSDEAAKAREPDQDLLERLAEHRRWLAREIRSLSKD